jgi:hypothetical protein
MALMSVDNLDVGLDGLQMQGRVSEICFSKELRVHTLAHLDTSTSA